MSTILPLYQHPNSFEDADFKLNSDYKPAGDQPEAIRELTNGLRNGAKNQILLLSSEEQMLFMLNLLTKQRLKLTLRDIKTSLFLLRRSLSGWLKSLGLERKKKIRF